MAFVDELTIYAKAGDGGDGVVRWRREKYEDMGGPAGGNGGNGGDLYVEAVSDVGILSNYSHNPRFLAENGETGNKKSMHGHNGKDLVIKLPVGTFIRDINRGVTYDLTKIGQKIKLLSGGRGGLGNEHFKASTNTTPYESTPGKPGEQGDYKIELRLFADLGLAGFPNAGKSSFLNAVTNAKSRIGAYPFTTLDPHLGAFYEFIIADIPGIIEGASEGKGLGFRFLKHVSRTKKILHLVSFEHELNEDGGMMKAYKAIREELAEYDPELSKKEEIILLTKTDVTDEQMVNNKIEEFKKLGKKVYAITMFDDKQVKEFSDELVRILRK